MAIQDGLTVIGSEEVGKVLECALHAVKEMCGLHMLLAITFEYSLLLMDATPKERAEIRAATLKEAAKQAKAFRAVALKHLDQEKA